VSSGAYSPSSTPAEAHDSAVAPLNTRTTVHGETQIGALGEDFVASWVARPSGLRPLQWFSLSQRCLFLPLAAADFVSSPYAPGPQSRSHRHLPRPAPIHPAALTDPPRHLLRPAGTAGAGGLHAPRAPSAKQLASPISAGVGAWWILHGRACSPPRRLAPAASGSCTGTPHAHASRA